MTSTLGPGDAERVLALDATDQARLVREGEISAEELVSASIDRIERLDPLLNAVCIRAYDRALEAVRAGLPEGPFRGVGYLLKDLGTEMAGLPLHNGSRYLAGHVSSFDSTIVTRLRGAGLVILGRAAACEFGMMPTVETAVHGTTRNPWDLTRTTGGSSGGSSAAVASGMVPMAGANDAGGSIRIPASACGLFGLKPSRARIPHGPRFGDRFGGIWTEHAVTRSVRDSAALLDVLQGPEPGDPYAVPEPRRPYVDEVGAPPGRLRIALTTKPPDGRLVDPEVLAAVSATAKLCEDLGHEIFERDLDELTPEVGEALGTFYRGGLDWMLKAMAREVGRAPEQDELEPSTRAFWDEGSVTAGDYLLAVTDLQAFSRRVAAAMSDFELWLSPTLGTLPPALGVMVGTPDDPFRGSEVAANLVSFPLVTANITGNPAMSVPLSWSENGLPIGSHFMAGFGREDLLFRLAAQLEEASPWHSRRPGLDA